VAAPTVGLTIIKKFTYRGNPEEWSNSYWLTGATPADSAAWRTLFDEINAAERTCYPSVVSVVAGYGYNSTSDSATAIWSVDMTVSPNTPPVGLASHSGMVPGPGDSASWVRWGLNRYNSKGKRIYLRKYFHPALLDPTNHDNIIAGSVTTLTAFGSKMHDGTLTGGRVITDKLGSSIAGHAVSPYATTRTLKRRGKRPPT